MVWFLFAAAAVLLYWCACTARERWRWETAEQAPPPKREEPSLEERLRGSATLEALGQVIDALLAVMDHPELGGPGYLTVQFPQQLSAGSFSTVTAQFPNIEGALYRRAVRQELTQGELTAAGVPALLFSHNPELAAEGGGVVALSAEVYGIDAWVERGLSQPKERREMLPALAAALQERYPALQVRVLAGDILLSPLWPEEDPA